MDLFVKIITCRFLLFLMVSLFGLSPTYAVTREHPVLIISSYNPDASSTSTTITDFMEEFDNLGGKAPIALENMNCKSFSESPLWKSKMKDILDKYKGTRTPSLLILIGQESWAAYLSQDSIPADVPVLTALASRNAIILPDDSTDLSNWTPHSVDLFEDYKDSPVKIGFVYDYDVDANINLIKKLYPDTKHIAFISGNSYGGVALQAHVVEEMKKHSDLDLILLDGRNNTIYTMCDRLRELPPNSAVLIGTWRVDMHDRYFMKSATYAMMDAAEGIPTFSLTSVGLGNWAIGGITPDYHLLGKEIAQQAYKLLNEPEAADVTVEVIPNVVTMDIKLVKKNKYDLSFIKEPIVWVNETPSYYDEYPYRVMGIIALFVILTVSLIITLNFYHRTKKMKDKLEISEATLRKAKDAAEETSKLKSAFLANMSHEIRTPLNAIVGFADVLALGGSSEEDQKGYVDIIKTNSDLLLRLINDILDLSRLEADRIKFTFDECDVIMLCQRVMFSVSQARQSENQYIFECDKEVLLMNIDAQRMQQVLINLLTNADKFTEYGKITLHLEVNEAEDKAIFTVTDTGTGIPPEKQKLVFDRFEKLNEFVQGTGLGLSICKLTVNKWGGDIWLDPNYTNGSRFVFTHPLHITSADIQSLVDMEPMNMKPLVENVNQ